MPGIEARAPDLTETRSGAVSSPKPRPVTRPHFGQRLRHRAREVFGIVSVMVVIVAADLGRDGEAGGDRQPELRHLGEIGALTSEKVALTTGPFGCAAAERVDPFRHALPTAPLDARRFDATLGNHRPWLVI